VWTAQETRVIGQCMRHLCVDSSRDACDWTVYETRVCVCVCGQRTRYVWLDAVWDTCVRTVSDTTVHRDDQAWAFLSVTELAGEENFLNVLLSKANAVSSRRLYVHHLIICASPHYMCITSLYVHRLIIRASPHYTCITSLYVHHLIITSRKLARLFFIYLSI